MSGPLGTRTLGIRRGLLIAVGVSLVVATAVVAWIGFGQVFTAVSRIGWSGLAVLAAWSALPIGLLGSAWFALSKPWRAADWRLYAWARMVRDASGELLPFSHVGGFFIGARAATLQGLGAPWAFASTVVDVTAELVAQIGFTGLGVVLLVTRLEVSSARDGLVGASVAGLAITAVAAGVFVGLQKRGMGLALALARRFLPAAAAGAAETGAMIAELHARPARFSLAVGAHLAAWIASALGPWLALRAAGIEIGPLAVVGLESLVMAVRSAAFVAPMGIGVQEASYVLLGPLFGLGPEVALAVSLIKRARDILIGLPVLFIWQGLEGRRLIAGRG
jgi:putative membrane protein